MAQSYTPVYVELLCHAAHSPYLRFPFKDKDEDCQETVRKDINCTFIFLGLEEPGLILSHLQQPVKRGKVSTLLGALQRQQSTSILLFYKGKGN